MLSILSSFSFSLVCKGALASNPSSQPPLQATKIAPDPTRLNPASGTWRNRSSNSPAESGFYYPQHQRGVHCLFVKVGCSLNEWWSAFFTLCFQRWIDRVDHLVTNKSNQLNQQHTWRKRGGERVRVDGRREREGERRGSIFDARACCSQRDSKRGGTF